jgi:hypothetical protein
VEGAEMRGYKVVRKSFARVNFLERKGLQHRKGVSKSHLQFRILKTPTTDENMAQTVTVLECEKQVFFKNRWIPIGPTAVSGVVDHER